MIGISEMIISDRNFGDDNKMIEKMYEMICKMIYEIIYEII